MHSRINNIIWKMMFTISILYIIMPIISRAISTYFTTYSYMLIALLIFIGVIFGNGMESLNEYGGGVLLPFILFQVLTFFTRTDSLLLWGYSVVLGLMPIIVGYHIVYYKSWNVPYYSNLIVFTLIITVLTTCTGLVKFPFAARILATIESSDNPEAVLYDWYNIGGYEFVYIIVLLYPILILAYKKRKIGLIPTILGVIACFSMVVLSEYTTALLLLMITSLLFLL